MRCKRPRPLDPLGSSRPPLRADFHRLRPALLSPSPWATSCVSTARASVVSTRPKLFSSPLVPSPRAALAVRKSKDGRSKATGSTCEPYRAERRFVRKCFTSIAMDRRSVKRPLPFPPVGTDLLRACRSLAGEGDNRDQRTPCQRARELSIRFFLTTTSIPGFRPLRHRRPPQDRYLRERGGKKLGGDVAHRFAPIPQDPLRSLPLGAGLG